VPEQRWKLEACLPGQYLLSEEILCLWHLVAVLTGGGPQLRLAVAWRWGPALCRPLFQNQLWQQEPRLCQVLDDETCMRVQSHSGHV